MNKSKVLILTSTIFFSLGIAYYAIEKSQAQPKGFGPVGPYACFHSEFGNPAVYVAGALNPSECDAIVDATLSPHTKSHPPHLCQVTSQLVVDDDPHL